MRSWLRHCATSRKVAGSIPDGVIGFLNSPNPSSRTMALGSTLTEKSTRNLSGGKGRTAQWADNLTSIWRWLSRKCGSLDVSQPYGRSRTVTGIDLAFTFLTTDLQCDKDLRNRFRHVPLIHFTGSIFPLIVTIHGEWQTFSGPHMFVNSSFNKNESSYE
jgi:hypothetical protein